MRSSGLIILLLFLFPMIILTLFIGIFVLVSLAISFPTTAYWISRIIMKIFEKTNLRFRHYVLVSVIISISVTAVMIVTLPAIVFIVIGFFGIAAVVGKFMKPTMSYH